MASEFKTADDIFECRLCGDCCDGFGGTYVTQTDIEKIASFISVNPKQFLKNYCAPSGSKFVLSSKKNGACIFFDKEKQCTIHPVKPYMCRAWPFLKTLMKNPENWNAMANSCAGMKKDVSDEDIKRIVSEEKQKLDDSLEKQSKKGSN